MIFADATFTCRTAPDGSVTGALDWGGGGRDLVGRVRPADATTPLRVAIIGGGRQGSPTAGWRYDYEACLAHRWPNTVEQTAALVGSVIRVKPHGAAPAGHVASCVAVRRR